jgi:tetratricopeptide (TPR) repeat protein
VFWLGALGATEQQLHVLRQKEFVQRARRSSVEGETEYAFRHVLVRDVAYGQIPRAERAQRHLRAAEWIESLGRPEDHSEMLAHHYVNALELSRASRRDVTEVERRTARALREAGERALALNALTQAENYLRQARALAPDDPELLLRYGRVLYLQDEKGEAELADARGRLPPEQAAEATLMLADIAWKQSRRADMETYLDEARSLVENLPASRAQAAVVNEVARYEMLAGRVDVALEHAREALAMAEQLGLDDLRIRALNTVGVGHVELGDSAGEDELREVIELASKLNLVAEMVRGWNNLTAAYGLRGGDLRQTLAGEAETLRLARHFGLQGFVRFIESAAAIGNHFHAGEWDDSLARAENAVTQLEQGVAVYSPATAYAYRGMIRVARDDADGANADAEHAFEHARRTGEPQALNPDMANAACIFTLVGNQQRADEAVTEALASLRPLRHLGFGAIESHTLAWAALQLGREAEVAEAFERESVGSVWGRAGLAVAARDLHAAAEIMAGSGFKTDAAFFRLQSGAEEDVRRALDFHRGVGATRYIREAEELLAVKA